jgi:hypothetical protein
LDAHIDAIRELIYFYGESPEQKSGNLWKNVRALDPYEEMFGGKSAAGYIEKTKYYLSIKKITAHIIATCFIAVTSGVTLTSVGLEMPEPESVITVESMIGLLKSIKDSLVQVSDDEFCILFNIYDNSLQKSFTFEQMDELKADICTRNYDKKIWSCPFYEEERKCVLQTKDVHNALNHMREKGILKHNGAIYSLQI